MGSCTTKTPKEIDYKDTTTSIVMIDCEQTTYSDRYESYDYDDKDDDDDIIEEEEEDNESSTEQQNIYVLNHSEMNDEELYIFGCIEKTEKKYPKIQHIKTINCGKTHCIITDQNDNYWMNGENNYGQLGVGTCRNIEGWHENKYFEENNIEIAKICTSCYSLNTFWITKNGELYGNGWNEYYQLGLEDGDDRMEPIHIDELHDVIDVECGYCHNMVICGSLITDINGIKYIISYWTKSIIIPHDIFIIINDFYMLQRKVYCTGCDNFGQLGLGQEYRMNNLNKIEWRLIESSNNIPFKSISCGEDYTLFLDIMGRMYSCGRNNYGQLGLGHNASKPMLTPYFLIYMNNMNNIIISKICAGYKHNLCLDVNGKVYSWGYNRNGQCGIDIDDIDIDTSIINKPQQIKSLNNYIIIDIKTSRNTSYAKSDINHHFLWGDNCFGQCTLKNINNINNNKINHALFDNHSGSVDDDDDDDDDEEEEEEDNIKVQCVPLLINDIFYQQTSGKRIKNVYLANYKTYIVGVS